MPHQDECSAIDDLTALLIEHGPAAMASALATLGAMMPFPVGQFRGVPVRENPAGMPLLHEGAGELADENLDAPDVRQEDFTPEQDPHGRGLPQAW
ncbi:MAG: hypothetical protein ACKOYJ_11420 [Planctomycetia bacterium]